MVYLLHRLYGVDAPDHYIYHHHRSDGDGPGCAGGGCGWDGSWGWSWRWSWSWGWGQVGAVGGARSSARQSDRLRAQRGRRSAAARRSLRQRSALLRRAVAARQRSQIRVRCVDFVCTFYAPHCVMLPTFLLIIISTSSPSHSCNPGLKRNFSTNHFHRCLPFLLRD